MNIRSGFAFGFWCVLALALSGCVNPGEMDQGAVARYQQAMMDKGPAPRESDEGLGVLKPVPGKTGPQLKVEKDPATGQLRIRLTLEEAIIRALANNLSIRIAGFDPGISREDMVIAAAEFDYVVFSAIKQQNQDQQTAPRITQTPFIINTTPPTLGFRNTILQQGGQANITDYQAGIKQKTITGAEWQLAWTMNRTWDNTDYTLYNKRYEPTLNFQLTQPLLRDAWPEFNLSRLQLARINHQISLAAFRQKVDETVDAVISTYWALIQARLDVEIQQRLLARTISTLNIISARAELDVPQMLVKQISSAEASRRAVLIRAQKTILDVQNRLCQLLADSQMNSMTDYEIIPVTPLSEVPVHMDVTDQVLTAMKHNPQLEQARLAISFADVNVKMAKNQTLPKLDLSVTSSIQGLTQNADSAWDSMASGNYLSFGAGLSLEYPVGNRAALAELSKQQLTRLQTITKMQDACDQVAVVVRERINEISTSYAEIQANRESVEAARAELLSLEAALEDRKTPEFLQVTLQAQEALANAARAELVATVNYNTAMINLARATGTVLEQSPIRIALPAAMNEADWRSLLESKPATKPAAGLSGETILPTLPLPTYK